jgi:SpoVK/Ycf46/Vps4 family AAA+-type ATPase
LKKKQRGVNVLIYGKPGTGKTEMAKTLCHEIGVPLFAISGNHSDEVNGNGRRSDLAAACSVLANDSKSVLMLDEAEDVFGAAQNSGVFFFQTHSRENNKSKQFFHKLLENNPVPVIWISNSIGGVDPAHLRRFSYAIQMESPDETVQEKIWHYSAKKHKVKLLKETVKKLVKTYDIAPAIIDTSLRTAKLMNNHDAVEKTIDALQSAMYGKTGKKEYQSEHEFSTALLNTDTDLEKLTQRILGMKGVNFSLCLYGISGSGKSAYARYLAEKLKMKVLHKRASDLLSCWVGEAEKNIAGTFAEAKRKKMLLVIDEADSFLQDRRNAHRSWEVTQVNEMLTQMERHPLPFVCTTNLMEGLDQASLRRFTFKVKYDYLKRPQVQEAFKHFFGVEPTVSLNDLTCLAPGDFAVVAKKTKICGIDDHKELVEMLRLEQKVKDVKSNRIGFVAE